MTGSGTATSQARSLEGRAAPFLAFAASHVSRDAGSGTGAQAVAAEVLGSEGGGTRVVTLLSWPLMLLAAPRLGRPPPHARPTLSLTRGDKLTQAGRTVKYARADES
eukprot:scaffold30635_cov35-Phaeocystis_antarctica.AAC.3